MIASSRARSWRVMVSIGISVLAVAIASPSCTPIEAPPSNAPTNRCSDHPCAAYAQEVPTKPTCQAGRCLVSGRLRRPPYKVWIVVHVSENAFFAPASTFVLYADDQGNPAFRELEPGEPPPRGCSPLSRPPCVQIGNVGTVTGEYTVTAKAAAAVGFPLADDTSIPVVVVYTPTGNAQLPAFEETLPLDLAFDASVLTRRDDGPRAVHSRVLPFGAYQRVLYPQAPYDEFFPPSADTRTLSAALARDTFVLGDSSETAKGKQPLDNTSDGSRLAHVTREEGLSGFRIWLEEASTRRRISVIRKLSGKTADVQLFTTGENRSETGSSLGDDVQVVVAPPDDWTAVPRYVSLLFRGAGLGNLTYPAVPPPVRVTGVVAFSRPEEADTLRGIPSKLTFESALIATRTDASSLLQYQTTVSTDDRGRFATILPPGNYVATVEPNSGTGFAKTRQPVTIDRDVTALTLKPPEKTIVRGRVVLTDERPIGEAEVIAIPQTPTEGDVPKPRPGRTKTATDGRYVLELDPGPYLLTVVPTPGTGFPRVVTHPTIPAQATVLPDIRVPAPTSFAFVLKDPSPTVSPVAGALVRLFAEIRGQPIEVGSGMTDADGAVEILLAPQPE